MSALQAQLEAVGLRLLEVEGHHRRDHEALAAAESRAEQLSGELRDGKDRLDDALSASSRLQVRERARGWQYFAEALWIYGCEEAADDACCSSGGMQAVA